MSSSVESTAPQRRQHWQAGPQPAALRARAARVVEEVRSQKLHDVADEFDSIHTIERALRVGSADRIIRASKLRPYVVVGPYA